MRPLIFIPLHDGKPVQHIRLQWVTLAIIALNIIVFAISSAFVPADPQTGSFANIAFGHIPSVANDLRELPLQYQIVPEYLYSITTITAAFLHGDIFHLGGNMLFIWVFGDNVEDAMGHIKYALFYLLCAFAAAWFHAFAFPESDAPLIGASGAAAGIVAAYLMLHPKMKIWGLVLGRIPLRLPAFIVLGLWIGYQIVMFVTDSDGNISWAAHIGGIAAGVVLVGLLKRRKVPLFDRELVVPEAVILHPEVPLPEAVKPSSSQNWGRGGQKDK